MNTNGEFETSFDEEDVDFNPEMDNNTDYKADEVDYKAKFEQAEAEAKKAKDLATNYKIRAEKAEKNKTEKRTDKSEDSFSQNDMMAIIRQNVHDDDIQEVKDYANLKGISIKEALETGFVKSLISENTEKRNVQMASHVGTQRRGTNEVSYDAMKSKIEGGTLSENDIDKFIQMQFDRKTK